MRQGLAILIILIFLTTSGARQPALAALHPELNLVNLGAWTIGSLALSTAVYFMYKNSPAQRARGYEEKLGPGEWYLAAYSGLSYLPSANWKFSKGWSVKEGWPPGIAGRTASNVNYEPGVVGGLKFGRYFDTLPWFGLEAETNFSRNAIRGSNGVLSPPVPVGGNRLFAGADWFDIWAMQFNLLVRYGFLKDKEVTFGRLQPYLGIGPGVEIVYAKYDSAKNLALETQAGLRYMLNSHLAIFFEYKFSYQWQVEYQNFILGKQSPGGLGIVPTSQTLSFDLPHHRFVFGISYHFKNLWGN